MNSFSKSVAQVFKGALNAFFRFPASIACAIAFAIVTLFRVQLDWPQEQAYYFLFNCLSWSLAFGALFSLAITAAERVRYAKAFHFTVANIIGLLAAAIWFLLLYNFGGKTVSGISYLRIAGIAVSRSAVAIGVSILAFIIIAGSPKERTFAESFFMTHKAFFIALIYGLVIWGGASGVARAFQYLLYNQMSSKVYSYIGTVAGLFAYTIFVGYFPDLRKGENEERREATQRQPRFIEVLFAYIMVPIALALTAVLLIWAGKAALGGMKVSFTQLSGIAAAYTLGGMWLSFMVSGHSFAPSKLYRRIYPIASLVILVFEAWAVIIRLNATGLKLDEYLFIMIWVASAAGALLLLIQRSRSHAKIAVIFCALAVVSVLPSVGYNTLPVKAQTERLEKLLTSQNMLSGGQIVPASVAPDRNTREAITDAVLYLAMTRDAKLPLWIDENLTSETVFRNKLGFEQTFPNIGDNGNVPGKNRGIFLARQPEAISISGYGWVVNPQGFKNDSAEYTAFKGKNGTYKIYWSPEKNNSGYILKILLDDNILLERSMKDHITKIASKYGPDSGMVTPASEDMEFVIETAKSDFLVVFSNVDIGFNQDGSINYYGITLSGIYIKEN